MFLYHKNPNNGNLDISFNVEQRASLIETYMAINYHFIEVYSILLISFHIPPWYFSHDKFINNYCL